MRKLVAVLMASTTIAACSGSNTDDSAIPIDQVPADLAKSYCAAEQACAPFFYTIAFGNTDCVTLLTKEFQEGSYNDLQNAVTAGTVKYDGNEARTCINAVGAGACTVLDNNSPASCQQAFTGTAETGADCDIDQECKGVSRCDVSGGTCPGQCAPLSSAGIACTRDDDCAHGLVCSTATSHCAAPVTEGQPCAGTTAGACAAGLLCVGNDDANKKTGTCMTAAATLSGQNGAACDLQKGPWCVAGQSCVVQSITPKSATADATLNSVCSAIAAPGGACGLGIPSQCPTGQYCPLAVTDLAAGTFMASCQPLPAEGQACGPAIGFTRCAANLVCDDTTAPLKPVCITPHDLGETCSADALCYSQHCLSGACVPASPCAK